MARIIMKGTLAEVELGRTDEDQVKAICIEHSPFDGRLAPPGACSWTETYDDWNDATEYAQDHADRGIQEFRGYR